MVQMWLFVHQILEVINQLGWIESSRSPQLEQNMKVAGMLCKLQGGTAWEDRKDAFPLTIHGGSMKIRHSIVLKSNVPSEHMDLMQTRLLPTGSMARVFAIFALLLCLSSVGWAQQNDQQQLRGLDEQVQEIKSDVLSISAELSRLEEKLLYPSGTQVAVFVSLAAGDQMRLDAVRIQIDGKLVAHHIYSFKELEALRKGGVQRIYVGNVATGDHQLEVLVNAKLEGGADFSRTERFTIRKEVKPKLVGLTLAGSGNTPIALGEW